MVGRLFVSELGFKVPLWIKDRFGAGLFFKVSAACERYRIDGKEITISAVEITGEKTVTVYYGDREGGMRGEQNHPNGNGSLAAKQITYALLADEHPIVRLGMMTVLKQIDPSFAFYEADTLRAAVDLARLHAPAIAIIDLSLAGSSSLEAIKKLKQAAPNMHILVVSHHDERVYAERAVRAGARGYVMKTIAAKLIGRAIQTVRDGKVWLSESLKDELVNRIAEGDGVRACDELRALSDREMSVFRLIGQGLKKGGIARELNLSPHTVESYRTNIKQKMGIASGSELYRIAFLHSQQSQSMKPDG